MKTLFLLISLSVLSPTDYKADLATINQIMASNSISINIELLDVGYIKNKQIYYIDVASNQVYITHRAMYETEQDNALNSTKVNPKVLDDLKQYFIQMRNFEINKKPEHDKMFNSKKIHQFITLQAGEQSILLSDVKDEGFTKIHQIILANTY